MAFWEKFKESYAAAKQAQSVPDAHVAKPTITEAWESLLISKGYERQAVADFSNFTKFASVSGGTFQVHLTCCSCKVSKDGQEPVAIGKSSLINFIHANL